MKTILVFATLTLTAALGLAATAASPFLQIEAGRKIFYKTIPGNPQMPTLVLLPGINRAVPENYPALKALTSRGFNIIITATSSHWQSLEGLGSDETPYYLKKTDLSSEDLYSEVETLVQRLKVNNPIMVSLSYSSALAAQSKRMRIFAAPLVKSSDSNPQAAQQAAIWEYTLSLNLVFGQALIRQFRDGGYRTYWSQTVNSQVSANPGAYGRNDLNTVIDGYCSLSRSLEGFDLSKLNLNTTVGPHLFILGEKESQVRLRGQLDTIMKAASKAPTEVILVKDAEHNVPDSQPEAYATAIAELVSAKLSGAQLKVGVIDPQVDSKKVNWMQKADVEKLIKHIQSFSDSTDASDLSSVSH